MEDGTDVSTRLEIPLEGQYYVNNKEIKVDILKLNKELNRRGLDGLPEVVVINKKPAPYWKLIVKRVIAANAALKREMSFNLVDYRNIYELSICYRGNIEDVPALIDAMNGNFLSEYQGILAIGAGKKKVIHDETFKSRAGLKKRFDVHYEGNLEQINRWLEYDSKSKTALVMSDYGQNGDGTELEVTEITPCK